MTKINCLCPHTTHSMAFVSSTNWALVNCSGRKEARGQMPEVADRGGSEGGDGPRLDNNCFSDTRNILRRWLKTVLTMRLNNCSSQPNCCTSLRTMRMTALCTLGRRIEHRRFNGKQVLHIVPRLDEYAEDAILLIAWLGSHAHSHLVLYHTRTTGYEVFIVEHLKEDLRRNIVGIVARQHKLLTIEHLLQVHPQEVGTQDILAQLREVLVEIGH